MEEGVLKDESEENRQRAKQRGQRIACLLSSAGLAWCPRCME